ncbi:MAG TPA: alpha-hydroxy-acid oxidizing protein [Bryobacterales bacterium]|nr:alpha-hydroxy-acid oxidizing protein [Bryobacterales bacterium]
MGRPYVWGLAAFGRVGVQRVLDMLRAELVLAPPTWRRSIAASCGGHGRRRHREAGSESQAETSERGMLMRVGLSHWNWNHGRGTAEAGPDRAATRREALRRLMLFAAGSPALAQSQRSGPRRSARIRFTCRAIAPKSWGLLFAGQMF